MCSLNRVMKTPIIIIISQRKIYATFYPINVLNRLIKLFKYILYRHTILPSTLLCVSTLLLYLCKYIVFDVKVADVINVVRFVS